MNNGADKIIQLIPRADSLLLERRWRTIITNSVNIEFFLLALIPQTSPASEEKERKKQQKQFQVKNLVQILAS